MATLVRSAVYEEKCPACGKENYYDIGDPEDITGVDLEVLQCWGCGKVWLIEIVDIEWKCFYPTCASKEEALRNAIENTVVELGRKDI